MKKTLLTLFLLLTLNGLTQKQKNRFNFNIMGSSPLFGISYERQFYNFGYEFGIGIISTNTGLKYYILNNEYNKIKPYVSIYHILNFRSLDAGWKTYIPVGIMYDKNNWGLSLEAGLMANWWDRKPYNNIGFGLKYGFKF